MKAAIMPSSPLLMKAREFVRYFFMEGQYLANEKVAHRRKAGPW